MPVDERVSELFPKVNAEVLGRVLQLSERRVQQLAKQGVIPRAERGKYDILKCCAKYIEYLKGQQSEGIDLLAEKARLTKEQADKVAMENELNRKGLIPAAEVEQFIAGTYKQIAQAVETFPDLAERNHGATPEVVAMLQDLGDKLRESLYEAAIK